MLFDYGMMSNKYTATNHYYVIIVITLSWRPGESSSNRACKICICCKKGAFYDEQWYVPDE